MTVTEPTVFFLGKVKAMGRLIAGSIILAHLPLVAADAAPPKLPIAQGVWVKLDTPCKAAFIAHIYNGTRFGTVYLYGPNQTMGPANETEALSHIGRGKNGFTSINDGPLEVAASPNGLAAIRAVSLSEGVQWTDKVRLCPPATLSEKFRVGLLRERLIPGGR